MLQSKYAVYASVTYLAYVLVPSRHHTYTVPNVHVKPFGTMEVHTCKYIYVGILLRTAVHWVNTRDYLPKLIGYFDTYNASKYLRYSTSAK